MANDAAALVQKFWNFCNVLRDDGVRSLFSGRMELFLRLNRYQEDHT